MTDEIFDDEYLWDRTGEPDEELARLERVLARYRLRHPLPPFAADMPLDGGGENDAE